MKNLRTFNVLVEEFLGSVSADSDHFVTLRFPKLSCPDLSTFTLRCWWSVAADSDISLLAGGLSDTAVMAVPIAAGFNPNIG